jgi:YVTN family beta-propeller protein
VAVNPVTNKIYVANQYDGTVTVIDGTNNSTHTIVGVALFPVAMALDPIRNKVYVVDLGLNELDVIDGATYDIAPVPVGMSPLAVAVNTVTNQIYVANTCGDDPDCAGDGTVTVIDGANPQQTTTVNVGLGPDDVAVNELTNQIYVANGGNNTVTVIDGMTNGATPVNVGNMPVAVVVNQVSNQIYVSNRNDNTVTVINGANNQTTTIPNVPQPATAGVDPATNKVYVVSGSDTLHEAIMIDGNTNNTTPIMVGNNPSAVGVDRVTNRIYVSNASDSTVSIIAGASAAALQFVALAPCRLVDTRLGHSIQGGTSQSFPLPQEGPCGATIPSGAAAYSLNVTVVPPPHTSLGYLTIWPTGEDQPVVSTLNSTDGRVKANAAIVPAGYQGGVTVYVTDTTDVILDIDGYFAPSNSQTLQFYPLTPCRLVDTRGSDGPLGGPALPAQMERDFPLLMNTTCIPQGLNPLAYSLNFTAVPDPSDQPLAYLSVWPVGGMQPNVSTLNNPTGTVVANAAIVPAGQNGKIAVYAYNTSHLLIDINGYFAAPGSGGYSFYPTAPCRVLDTRANNAPPFNGTLSPPVNVVGSQCAPPSTAQGYVFNATVVPSGSLGYLTLWPDGEQNMPVVSTLNAADGFVTSNMAIVPNIDGSTDAYAFGSTYLILDISGYFAP